MNAPRLQDLSRERKLALGLFLLLLLGFYGLAQVKLFTAVSDGSGYPGAEQVLKRYHGDPGKSLLHRVLDPSLPVTEPKRMYGYLGATDEEQAANRTKVLSWVERAAPRAEWAAVAPIFSGDSTCGQCHSTKPDAEGKPRTRADLPFETYEQVVAASQPDTGMSIHELSTSAHNHMMGFAVIAILASWIFTATRWRGPIVFLLILGAFLGAAVDVGSWWLTHFYGHPYEYLVLIGGGLFGCCTMGMVLLSLDELWLCGALGSLLAKIVGALRLGSRDVA